ncbi:lactate utilization protein C [Geothrix sp. PMB-07]|uniref:LutC/YkgG family protein n=1 Tax=Geothrix sp. PMB-07 TaxID=3068640 RepID=UPI002740FCB1|nr:lactate utilization protein C [Geothrix sp. PMB-07]WLT33493.1 lactate utilization protein C [Geothrix sp. PMB-07]
MTDTTPSSTASSTARAAILGRLRAAGGSAPLPPLDLAVLERRHWPARERMERLRKGMEAVHTEFLEATPEDWTAVIQSFCAREGLKNLLYGPGSEAGTRLAADWVADQGAGGTQLMPYDRPVESFKDELFNGVEAGFTGTVGGVAETGGLLLMPDAAEPRLLSLVPPIHLALLRASTIQDSFWSAVKALGWGRSLPPNALMISGPSKTADIEQTLAYGVHGPKRLIVVLVDDLGAP